MFRTQHPLIVEEGSHGVRSRASVPARRDALGADHVDDAERRRAARRRESLRPPVAAAIHAPATRSSSTAIATQIGTAIQNARLVRASLDQQRLLQEMQLAHDLQMKLLPRPTIVAPEAEVAARVVPAESVGGDFYHLFRLPRRRDRA